MTDFNKEMGNRIKERYKALNMSQFELSEKVDISPNHLSAIISGASSPSLPVFMRICKALHVNSDYLLLGTMSSDDVMVNIVDSLKLCDEKDLKMIYDIIQLFVIKNNLEDN